ncbi:MAG: DUF4129 domain-containing protein [Sandaracinaceae bacterium]|nr:DUF4129 domain-containing protein [Sandaracinaceae bacterium]
MNALDWIDRAFVLLRMAGRRLFARCVLGAAPLALVCVFAFYLERVEGIRSARAGVAWALTLAWWFRSYAHAQSGAVLLSALGGEHSPPKPLDTLRVGGVAGILLVFSLFPAAGLARLGGPGLLFGLGFAVPVGALAPAWLLIAAEPADGVPRTWWAAARAGAGLRGSALLLHVCLFLGTVLLFLNAVAVVGMTLAGLQGLLGLEVSAIGAFMSFENDFALLATAALVLLLVEPVRVALAAVAVLHARARRDGADLRTTLLALSASSAPARPRAREAALLLLLGAALTLPRGALAQLATDDENAGAVAETVDAPDVGQRTPTESEFDDEARSEAGGATLGPAPSLSAADQVTERELARILSGSEFREFEDAPMAGGPQGRVDWLTRLLDALERWLRSLRASAPEGSDANTPMPVPPTWAFVALAVTLLLAVVAFLLLSWRRERRARSDVASPLGASDDPRERAPGDHLDDAGRLAAEGHYRLAFRALYLATLVALDRSGEIDFDPARTNWHYLRRMGSGSRADAFRTFTALFDRTWYGDEPTSRPEYERGRSLATTLTLPRRDDAERRGSAEEGA